VRTDSTATSKRIGLQEASHLAANYVVVDSLAATSASVRNNTARIVVYQTLSVIAVVANLMSMSAKFRIAAVVVDGGWGEDSFRRSDGGMVDYYTPHHTHTPVPSPDAASHTEVPSQASQHVSLQLLQAEVSSTAPAAVGVGSASDSDSGPPSVPSPPSPAQRSPSVPSPNPPGPFSPSLSLHHHLVLASGPAHPVVLVLPPVHLHPSALLLQQQHSDYSDFEPC
jgi:hypothetical protein